MSEKFRFPDTGQKISYDQNGREIILKPGDELYGQDGCFVVNPISFTKLGLNEEKLSPSACWEDGFRMVKDNNTGLIWEVKSPNSEDPNYFDNKYSFKDAQEVYVNKLNEGNYGGFKDWRIPNKDELRSIINYSKTNPALDQQYFPHCRINYYWCSLTYEMQSCFGWAIFLGFGSATAVSKESLRHVLAVRKGYNNLFGKQDLSRFTDNKDGTITDHATDIMWQKDENERMSWYEALKFCQNMKLAGYNDWRLPDIKELNTILNLTHKDGWWYFRDFFPGKGLQPPLLHYFSSSVFEKTYAWVTNFNFGYDGYYANKNAKLLFRAARKINPPREINAGNVQETNIRDAQETNIKDSKEIAPKFILPDTGQILCYDNKGNQISKPEKGEAFYGQDGCFINNPTSFAKLGDNEHKLTDDAAWDNGLRMVKDNNTGLVWEVKSLNSKDINYKENRYTWNGAQNYIDDLNRQKYGGFDTWRLPNKEELRTIINYNDVIPAVDQTFFPNILTDFYWSKDPYVPDPKLIWGIYSAYGCAIAYLKDSLFPVMAVCKGNNTAFGDSGNYKLKDNKDGTITDFNTGLMWKKDESPEMSLIQALKYCEDLTLAGYNDWHMPNIKEIATLIDLSFKDSTWFHKEFFPDVKTTPLGFYWSSSTFAATFGWGVNFQFGYDGYYADKINGCYPFRPVRIAGFRN